MSELNNNDAEIARLAREYVAAHLKYEGLRNTSERIPEVRIAVWNTHRALIAAVEQEGR